MIVKAKFNKRIKKRRFLKHKFKEEEIWWNESKIRSYKTIDQYLINTINYFYNDNFRNIL